MINTAKHFFSKPEKEEITASLKAFEMQTSGEIRVHIETHCHGDVLDRAATVFEKLGMIKTKERNGILFYLAINDRKFAIIGDAGINKHVTEDFWETVKLKMLDHFKEGKFSNGLIEGIEMAGNELKKYYPFRTGDQNELPDDISFDNEEK